VWLGGGGYIPLIPAPASFGDGAGGQATAVLTPSQLPPTPLLQRLVLMQDCVRDASSVSIKHAMVRVLLSLVEHDVLSQVRQSRLVCLLLDTIKHPHCSVFVVHPWSPVLLCKPLAVACSTHTCPHTCTPCPKFAKLPFHRLQISGIQAMIDSQVVAVLASVIRPTADGPDSSALLAPTDLQRTLRALATLARADLAHDDIASFVTPSLAILLNSLLASVSRGDGEDVVGSGGGGGGGAGAKSGWREGGAGAKEGAPSGPGGGVEHEDDAFAVVSTLSQDNVDAAAETLLLVLQASSQPRVQPRRGPRTRFQHLH
jgi:hypothetical protein